jgi:hypothetical protein
MWAIAVGSLVSLGTRLCLLTFLQIATFPFSWLYGHFGARFVFFGAGILSAVSTGLIPLAASVGGIWAFTVLRLLQVKMFDPICNFKLILGYCICCGLCCNRNSNFSLGLIDATRHLHQCFDMLLSALTLHYQRCLRICKLKIKEKKHLYARSAVRVSTWLAINFLHPCRRWYCRLHFMDNILQ